MMNVNALVFIAAQFGSRFLNSFLTTAVRYELLEIGGVRKFTYAQVATQLARVFMQQAAGLLTDNFPLKRLYVFGEASNLMFILALLLVSSQSASAGTILLSINIGLGLSQAFLQPVSKSMPPAVVKPEDLAIANSWDLTGDKIGRNLAPMAFTVVSSALGFRTAILLGFSVCLILIAAKQVLEVADNCGKNSGKGAAANNSITAKFRTVFSQVADGLLSLRSDYTIGLLIFNTLVTNMFVYPLGTIVFPVIFKAIPDGAIEQEGSLVSRLLLSMQGVVGIQKEKAWMNYSALVSLGGVIGPFASNAIVYRIQATPAGRSPERLNWLGVNCGIGGQLVSLVFLVQVLANVQTFTAGSRIFFLFVVWGTMTAFNNVTTIYFNAITQQHFGRSERGRFIANILTLFTIANSIGSIMYGGTLSSADFNVQISSSTRLLLFALLLRFAVLIGLHVRRGTPHREQNKKDE